MIVRPSRGGRLDRQAQAVAVPLLHALDAAAALDRHQRGVEDDAPDPAVEGGDHSGHDQAARGMRHQRDRTGWGGRLDVGHDGRDLVVDGQRGQVRRP